MYRISDVLPTVTHCGLGGEGETPRTAFLLTQHGCNSLLRALNAIYPHCNDYQISFAALHMLVFNLSGLQQPDSILRHSVQPIGLRHDNASDVRNR